MVELLHIQPALGSRLFSVLPFLELGRALVLNMSEQLKILLIIKLLKDLVIPLCYVQEKQTTALAEFWCHRKVFGNQIALECCNDNRMITRPLTLELNHVRPT